MKLLILVLLFVTVGLAFAAPPELTRDLVGAKVQGFAPDGRKDITLTINSQTVDMRNDLQWSAFAPGDCSFRCMSTTTKTGSKRTIKGGSWTPIRVRSLSTPFVNFTSCTSGELQRQ